MGRYTEKPNRYGDIEKPTDSEVVFEISNTDNILNADEIRFCILWLRGL